MKKLTLAATLVLAPSAMFAQASVQSQATAGVSATSAAQAGSDHKLSAEAQAKVDANLSVAREKKLPEEPIRQRVAEGQAKGASDAQIAEASGRTLADLQTSFDAMVKAGRANPTESEIASGAQLIARGYTSAQLVLVAKQSTEAQLRSLAAATGSTAAGANGALNVNGAVATPVAGATAGVAGAVNGVLGGKKP